jgi:hypothetical protein
MLVAEVVRNAENVAAGVERDATPRDFAIACGLECLKRREPPAAAVLQFEHRTTVGAAEISLRVFSV